MTAPPAASPRRTWVEPVVALLMALTTLCTAWCSYQSAAWTRRSNRLMSESNSMERQAALMEVQGSQTLVIHASMFMQLLAAQHAGNEALATFYAGRFPPDVRQAHEKWLAQKPLENPAADPHPFVPHLYEVRGSAEAAVIRTQSEQKVTDSRAAGDLSGQFLANTVFFAAVLFFAGTAGKFEQPRVRLLAMGFGVALFLFAVVRTLLMPAA
jgi:hypothetical protein